MSHSRIRAILLASSLLAFPLTALVAEEPTARVARLIRNLGSPSFEERAHATRQLADVGIPAKSQLQQAAEHDDPEIQLRARRLLKKLKVDQLWQASRVDYQAAGEPASEAFATIAEQTGNRILVGDQYGKFHEARGDLQCSGTEFWLAVDDLCRQSNNHVRPHYDTRNPGLVVVSGAAGRYPTAYAGPIRSQITGARRVFIEEFNYENFESEVTHTFQFNVQMMWEDRFRLIAYRSGAKIVEAVTDTGIHLSATRSSGGGWNVASRGTRQLSMSLRLHPPPASARKLSLLRLRWGLLAVGDWASIDVGDLKTSGVDYTQHEIKLRFQSLKTQRPGRYELTVVVARDAVLPEPREALFEENEFELFDAQGHGFTRHGQTNRLSEDGVRYKLTFSAPEAGAEPALLRLRYPRVRSQRDVEIVFHDVPLPVAIPD